MKCRVCRDGRCGHGVAPFTGAWIEIYKCSCTQHSVRWSLPSRERGLKWVTQSAIWSSRKSLPSRERGLKYIMLLSGAGEAVVAPFTGAWIEIVWADYVRKLEITSLPSRERGLKLSQDTLDSANALSLPSRERGLKFSARCLTIIMYGSLPSRERGLKFAVYGKFHLCTSWSLPSRERGLKFLVA